MTEILIVGYPRSGNVWAARLLGDALDCPVVGLQGGNGTLAAEGQDRPEPGYVMQAHARPGKGDAFWCGHLQVDLRHKGKHKLVLMVRDPRDVLVSASEFWGWTLEDTMQRMVEGPGPVDLPPWREYMEAWENHDVPLLCYEHLYWATETVLVRLLAHLEELPRKPLAEVIERQSFAVKRATMEHDGESYPFGREAQLKHLRKGETGEWQTRLSPELQQEALAQWGAILEYLGYEKGD